MSSYFENQAPTGIHALLASLEGSAMLLGDEDQGFVIGCRQALNEGGMLTPQNQAQLQKIAGSIAQQTPDMGGISVDEKPISTLKILQDLANNIHTLNLEERKFANQMASKYKKGQAMSAQEMQKLMTLYGLKGF